MPSIKEEQRAFIKVTRENAISERFLEAAEVNQYGLKLTIGDKSGAAITEQLFTPKEADLKVLITPLGKEYTKLKAEIRASKDWKGIGEKFKALREEARFKKDSLATIIDRLEENDTRNILICRELLMCYYDSPKIDENDWTKFFTLVAKMLQNKGDIGIRVKLVYKKVTDKETEEVKYYASLPKYKSCIEKMSVPETKSKLKIEDKDLVERPEVAPNDVTDGIVVPKSNDNMPF